MAAVAPASRLEGFDLARGLAVFGMVTVHFVLVMTQDAPPSPWAKWLLDALDGRPAATFVVLAGMGVSLMAQKATAKGESSNELDRRLRRRGVLLLVCGYLNLLVWPGDILRVYGVSLLLAPWFVRRSARSLLQVAGAFFAGFMVLMLFLDYDRYWDWNTMTYHGLWTAEGLVRNLFYDGFRSVFPWTGLLVLGMWAGRWNWCEPAVARKAMQWGATCMLVSWGVSNAILQWLAAHPQPDLNHEDAVALFGVLSMPPLPLFLLNAGGCALLTVGVCTWAALRFGGSLLNRAISAVGRLAFTWYIAHIFVGLGAVLAFGWTDVSPELAFATGVAFCALAAVISLILLRRFRSGPLEALLRRVG